MSRRMRMSLAGGAVAAPVVASARKRRRKAGGDAEATDDVTSHDTDEDKRGPKHGVQKVIRLITLALAAASVVKELRTPADQRTWHGTVAGFVPYDFRFPTLSRIRAAVWNPEGRLISARAFGVGWTLNAGRVVHLVRERVSAAT